MDNGGKAAGQYGKILSILTASAAVITLAVFVWQSYPRFDPFWFSLPPMFDLCGLILISVFLVWASMNAGWNAYGPLALSLVVFFSLMTVAYFAFAVYVTRIMEISYGKWYTLATGNLRYLGYMLLGIMLMIRRHHTVSGLIIGCMVICLLGRIIFPYMQIRDILGNYSQQSIGIFDFYGRNLFLVFAFVTEMLMLVSLMASLPGKGAARTHAVSDAAVG